LLTIGLPDMPLVPVGPGFYPRIVLGLTAFLGLWLLIADYRLQQRHGAQARLSTFRWISILSPYKAVVNAFRAICRLHCGDGALWISTFKLCLCGGIELFVGSAQIGEGLASRCLCLQA